MGKKDLSPDRRFDQDRPGSRQTDDEARPWATIELGLLKHRGPGDLLDMDPDVCGSLEVRPEDAGGLC